jgi:hypothetical protein
LLAYAINTAHLERDWASLDVRTAQITNHINQTSMLGGENKWSVLVGCEVISHCIIEDSQKLDRRGCSAVVFVTRSSPFLAMLLPVTLIILHKRGRRPVPHRRFSSPVSKIDFSFFDQSPITNPTFVTAGIS